MRIKTIIGFLVLIVFAVIGSDQAFSQDDDMLERMAADEELQQEFKWLKAETYVITASRIMEKIKKAPASISVVTNRQIRQMGAKDLNVITKEAEDLDGFELTVRGGSWNTQQYNLLFGKTFNDFEVAFNFNFFKTHGFRGLIEEDFQTYLDGRWAPFPSSSLAPGRMDGDDPSGYAIVNTTLIAKKFLKGCEGLELRGSIYNLFDKDYTDPQHPIQLPNDWPMPGRNYLLEMKFTF